MSLGPRAETARRPEIVAALTGLMGGTGLDPEQIRGWLPDWKLAFEGASGNTRVDARIHPVRSNYDEKRSAPCSKAPPRILHSGLYSKRGPWL